MIIDGAFPKLTAALTAGSLAFGLISVATPNDEDRPPVEITSVLYERGFIIYERTVSEETAGYWRSILLDPDPASTAPAICTGEGTALYSVAEDPRKVWHIDTFFDDPGCLSRLSPGEYRVQTVVIPRSGKKPDVHWFDIRVEESDVELSKDAENG